MCLKIKKILENSKSQNQFPKPFPNYNMIYNAIPKFIQEENSVIEFKYKLRNLLITKAYYIIIQNKV